MSWDADIARQRIRDSIEQFQPSTFEVRDFKRDMNLDNISGRSSYVIHGAHIYAQVLGYHDILAEKNITAERIHQRLLNFLHLNYRSTDIVLENEGAKRVDFHGPRLHAIVFRPYGNDENSARERTVSAIRIAQTLAGVLEEASQAAGLPNVRLRVGIDEGPCLLINSGAPGNKEPVFVGPAANYAAKLAGNERKSGVYLSRRCRQLLKNVRQVPADSPVLRKSITLFEASESLSQAELLEFTDENVINESVSSYRVAGLSEAAELKKTNFSFRYFPPPLKRLDYEKLVPSNSILMPLVATFADIDGYTNFVDDAIRTGNIQMAATVLNVIRSELTQVMQEDFNGRKVRLIGDCLHAISATGNQREIEETESITDSVLCAAAMQSSFEIVRSELPAAAALGLAVGIEIGNTPVTRLGLRGEMSVRVATGSSCTIAEMVQESLEANEVGLGDSAWNSAHEEVRALFDAVDQKTTGLRYPQVSMAFREEDVESDYLAALAAPTIITSSNDQPRPHAS